MPLEFDFVPTLEVEMITGIQITKADNDDLLHSFWLLDDENGEARCICAKKALKKAKLLAVMH